MQIFLFLFASLFIVEHELHLSMASITYNQDARRIEVQQRIFFDDLERSLRIQLDSDEFNVLEPENSELSYDSLFQDYFNKHVDFYVNEDKISLDLLEYEISDDAIILYLYKSKIKKLKSIDIFSHLLFELFDDQNNVITVQAHGIKKSGKFGVSSKPMEIVF